MFGTIYEPLTFKPARKTDYVWNYEERARAERANAKLARQVDSENRRILNEEIIPAIKARGWRVELEARAIALATSVFSTTYANCYKGVY